MSHAHLLLRDILFQNNLQFLSFNHFEISYEKNFASDKILYFFSK